MLKRYIVKHTLNTRSSFRVLKRFNSTNIKESAKVPEKDNTSALDEFDPTLLDSLFIKNKPVKKLYYQGGSFTKRQEFANRQEVDKFHILNTNLSNFKSSTPVNFNYYLRNLKDLKNANQLPYNFGENQLILDKNDEVSTFLKNIIWEFNAPIRFSFGYGSKIFSQGVNSVSENTQTDLIFAVTYPNHWHSINLNQFPDHYSNLKFFGSNFISTVQDMGAGVYFNPFVKMNIKDSKVEANLKYGVISMERLIHDLINWDNMYISGRLHKPVAIIRNSPAISLLNQYNLTNAIKLSVLLLNKPVIKESELYHKISSLSYTGDPRLKYGGEHVGKISNIVDNQFKEFRKLYLPLLQNYFPSSIQQSSSTSETDDISFNINLSSESKARFIVDLPLSFRKRLFSKYQAKYSSELQNDKLAMSIISPQTLSLKNTDVTSKDIQFVELNRFNSYESLEDIPLSDWEYLSNNFKSSNSKFVQALAKDKGLSKNLESVLSTTISTPAMTQSLKGILTAGVSKSFWYAYEKRQKYHKSLKQ